MERSLQVESGLFVEYNTKLLVASCADEYAPSFNGVTILWIVGLCVPLKR